MNRILTLIGLIKKANLLRWGFETVCDSIADRTAKLVLITGDISPKTKKEIVRACEEDNVPVIDLLCTMAEIEGIINKRTGVMSICEIGFAKKLLSMLDETTGRKIEL